MEFGGRSSLIEHRIIYTGSSKSSVWPVEWKFSLNFSTKRTWQISTGWQVQRPGVKGNKTAVLKKIQGNSFFPSDNFWECIWQKFTCTTLCFLCLAEEQKEETRRGMARRDYRNNLMTAQGQYWKQI